MKKSLKTRILSVFLLTAMLAGSTLPVLAVDSDTGGAAANGASSGGTGAGESAASDTSDEDGGFGYSYTKDEVLKFMDSESYMVYSERYANVSRGTDTVIVEGASYDASHTDAEVEVLGEFEGKANVLQTPATGSTSWKVVIPKTGKYAISVEYYNLKGTNTTIERMLYIDGKLPFTETRYLYFPRTWEYEYQYDEDGNKTFEKDMNGNDVRPIRNEVYQWRDYYIRDWVGYTMDPFEFYLEAGLHPKSVYARRLQDKIQTDPLYIRPSHEYNNHAIGKLRF